MVNAQHDRGKGESATQVSMTVLEHVLVLAVAQEAGRDETKPKVVSAVTLELSLEDAEKLDLARSIGTLSLVLRNQLDKKTVATSGVTKSQLLGLKQVVAVQAPASHPAALTRTVATRRTQAKPTPVAPAICVEVIRKGTRALDCF
jgi:pilus assembly protein CpaB